MPRVKVCGVTVAEDLDWLDGLVDYVGFVVSRRRVSPRVLEPLDAAGLASTVSRSRRVLVVHGYSLWEAAEMAVGLGVFDTLQYHDRAVAGELAAVAEWLEAHGVSLAPVSFWHGGGSPVPDPCLLARSVPGHEYVLVDRSRPGPSRLDPLVARAYYGCGRLGVAGGINPGNVCDYVSSSGPFLVDTSSGVESSPGRKSRVLVQRLVEVVGSCRG